MSKKLYLIRHSYAENPGLKKDVDRSLTLEGQSTVRALGRHLRERGFSPDIILCSSAKRTSETATNLVEELGMSERAIRFLDVIYNASVREMLDLVNQLDAGYTEVAIIGHNPTISFFSEFLTASVVGNMSPSSLVTIDFGNTPWSEVSGGSGHFVSYFHPNER